MNKPFQIVGLSTLALVLSSCSQTAAPGASYYNTQTPTPTVTASALMTPTSIMTPTASPAAIPVTNPQVTMETSMGTIEFTLFMDKAPKTAENFATLAKSGFYDGVLFHRVIPNFMAQSGDPLTKDNDPYNDGTGGPGYTFDDEISAELKNERGMVAMANRGPNTNGSQFFINVVDNHFLDGKYSVFAQVTKGMEIVDAITKVATNTTDPRLKDRPLKAIKINKVTVK